MKFIFTTVFYFLFFTQCFSSETIQKSLLRDWNQYVTCMKKEDLLCQTYFLHPAIIKEAGTKEKLIRALKQFYSDLKERGDYVMYDLMEFKPPFKVYRNPTSKKVIIAIIPYKFPVMFSGKKYIANTGVVAISEDEGGEWFFVDADLSGQNLISRLYPTMYSQIKFPNIFSQIVE